MYNPWSIQLEVTEGCNFRCWFCGIHAIRGKDNDLKHMDPELIVRPAAREINSWLPKVRIELNNHGEPTLNPNFYDIVSILRKEAPRCQIQTQTNGSTFISTYAEFKEFVEGYLVVGGNILAINCYKQGYYDSAMRYCKQMQEEGFEFKLIDFYYDNPDNYSAYRYYKADAKMIFIFQDLGIVNVDGTANTRQAKKINNEGGSSPKDALKNKLGIDILKEPLNKGCSRVFRELTIGWNGIIPVCCYNWTNDLVFGKFPESSLQYIWESSYWNAARSLLHPTSADRNFAPCSRCDYAGGFRLGLLPDPPDIPIRTAKDLILDAQDEFIQYLY